MVSPQSTTRLESGRPRVALDIIGGGFHYRRIVMKTSVAMSGDTARMSACATGPASRTPDQRVSLLW